MSIPVGEKRDERAELLSDLRALLDMLENEPSLPAPITMHATVYVPRVDGDMAVSLTEVFTIAEMLGTDVTYDRREGRVETTWKRGSVTYSVFTRLPQIEAPSDLVTLTSPAQILTTTSTIVRPDLAEREAGDPS